VTDTQPLIQLVLEARAEVVVNVTDVDSVVCISYSPTGVGKQVSSASLYHFRQCCVVPGFPWYCFCNLLMHSCIAKQLAV